MKKPRLLALTTSYPLRAGGCAGLFIQSLYRRLSATYSIQVVCPGDAVPSRIAKSDDSGADIRLDPVRYAPRRWCVLAQRSGGVLPGLKHAPWRVLLLPMLLWVLFLRCLTRAGDADVIHANWAVCGAMAGLVGRLRRKPVITTLRGDDVTRAVRSWLDHRILAMAVRGSRIVVCVSEAMAEQLRAQFPSRAGDIHVCLNGVDEAFLEVSRVSADANRLSVLAVGSLIRRKGFDVLIEAVARARCRENMDVTIVGDGPERESLLALAASRGVAGLFDFAGEVSATTMPARFSRANVFVLPSRSEGRPNVVVEALASGLPVICTNLDGVQGMVEHGDNGWVFAIDDADGLGTALDRASSDPDERLRRGARARASARARIGTWADTAHCYDALFRLALDHSRKTSTPCAE